MAVYTRHLINGLDVRDGLVYTRKPSPLRGRTALLNFIVLALGAWVVIATRRRVPGTGAWPVSDVPASWRASLTVLLLPVVAIIPGAIETRFFVPLHLLAYCVIAMHFDAAQLRRDFDRHSGGLILTFVTAAAVFFALSTNTLATLQYDWPAMYRIGPSG